MRIVRAALKRRRLRIALTCDEPCRATIAARLKRVKRLATRRRTLAANTRTVVHVKPARKIVRKLRRTLRRRGVVRLVVRVSATDAAGNRSLVTRRGRLTRPR